MLLNYRWFSTNSKQSGFFFFEKLPRCRNRVNEYPKKWLSSWGFSLDELIVLWKDRSCHLNYMCPSYSLFSFYHWWHKAPSIPRKNRIAFTLQFFWWRDWTSACKMTFKGQMLNCDQGELRNPWRSFVRLSTYMYRVKVRVRVRICDPNCFLLSTTNKQIQNTNKSRREGVWRDESTIMGS